MDQIDFQDERVKETISNLAKETGMNLQEIMKEFEYAERNKTYVRFKEGGKVGYYFPSPILFPYSRAVYLPDGSVVLTMAWDSSYEVISEEEYQKAIGERN